MPKITLYMWGPVLFELYPLNVDEVDHVTMTEWARKEIAGSAVHREWVGENEEEILLRGKVFPRWYASHLARSPVAPKSVSGIDHLDLMDNMRMLGQAHTLIRGDGWHLGWYVIERFSRGHSFLDSTGIGQQLSFAATFQRVPVPDDPAAYFPSLWGQTK